MEKMTWTRPVAVAEQFMPTEYISACGESGTTYNFKCNAPAGALYYYPDRRASSPQPSEWPTKEEYQGYWPFGSYETVTAAELLGSFNPCPAAHEANATNGFYWGFIDYNRNDLHDSSETVIVWRGANGTQMLDMNSWEIARS